MPVILNEREKSLSNELYRLQAHSIVQMALSVFVLEYIFIMQKVRK